MQVQVHQSVGDSEMTTKAVSADVSWNDSEITLHLPDEAGIGSVSFGFDVSALLKRVLRNTGGCIDTEVSLA